MKNAVILICTNKETEQLKNVKMLQQKLIGGRNNWKICAILCGDERDGARLMNVLYWHIEQGTVDCILSDSPQTFANALGCGAVAARRFIYRLAQENINVCFSEEPFFNCQPPLYFGETLNEWTEKEAKRYADFLKELNRYDLNRESWENIGRCKRRY